MNDRRRARSHPPRLAYLTAFLVAVTSSAAASDAHSLRAAELAAASSEDRRLELPIYRTIPAAPVAEMTPANGWPHPASYRNWSRSHGGPASTRYSSLDQIHRGNVGQLELAWTYRSGDRPSERGLNIQANPIFVDGVLYAPTVGRALVALDAATGRELWRYLPDEKWGGAEGEATAQRGLVHWPGDGQHSARLLFNAGQHLYAPDPKTGRPIEAFGERGRTRTGIVATAGAIYRRVITLPSKSEPAVFGYDIITGRQLWRFNTAPQPGERFHDPAVEPQVGARGWGGIALDESRGLVFLCLGNPRFMQGIAGPSNESLFGNCVVALEAETGRYVWHFQEIRHDIWDLDLPAPPILATVERHGKRVDAVIALTKFGNTLVLDRVTGRPLFDFRLRRAPVSRMDGVATWPYQPDLVLPEPFARQTFSLDHVTTRTPEARADVLDKLKSATFGWFEPYQRPDQRVVFYGIHGGAEWTGGCLDPATGIVYVSSNEIPWFWAVTEFREAGSGLANRFSDRSGVADIIRRGRNVMPPVAGIADDEVEAVINYLYSERAPTSAKPRYVHSGMGRLLDHEGFPGTRPPWGNLVAIDANTGRIRWKVPLGEHPGMPASAQPTGTENFGGPTVTAGGLVFCAGTTDHLIRAFDSGTGEELWRYKLPHGGYAAPAVYEVNGRQHVVIAATSGGKLGGSWGTRMSPLPCPRVRTTRVDAPGRPRALRRPVGTPALVRLRALPRSRRVRTTHPDILPTPPSDGLAGLMQLKAR
jgi:quinoprotein glucose dehydrogenase